MVSPRLPETGRQVSGDCYERWRCAPSEARHFWLGESSGRASPVGGSPAGARLGVVRLTGGSRTQPSLARAIHGIGLTRLRSLHCSSRVKHNVRL
jgi:hypothetical protein